MPPEPSRTQLSLVRNVFLRDDAVAHGPGIDEERRPIIEATTDAHRTVPRGVAENPRESHGAEEMISWTERRNKRRGRLRAHRRRVVRLRSGGDGENPSGNTYGWFTLFFYENRVFPKVSDGKSHTCLPINPFTANAPVVIVVQFRRRARRVRCAA